MASPRIHKLRFDKARTAEWLLTRVSTKRRAAEIIGDLLETPQRSLAFWISVAGLFFTLGSRILLAPVFALGSFAIPLVAFRLSANSWHHVPHHFDPWMRVASLLMIASMFLWTVPALALARFGRRDLVTLISFALALLLTLSSCFAWLPFAFVGIPAAFVMSLVTLCLHRPWRRPLLCIVGTVAFLALLISAATRLALSVSTIRDHDNDLSGFLIWSISICIEAWVLNALHARFLSTTAEPAAPPPVHPA